jgi:tRNA ligase
MSTKNNRSVDRGGDEEDALVRALDALSLKNKRLVRATVHDAPADPNLKISSWKMDEFKYSVHPSPFPTLARGLFTRKVVDTEDGAASDDDSAGGPAQGASLERRKGHARHVIVARGYDKFFNIGEVPWNSVSIEMFRLNICSCGAHTFSR